MIPFFSVLQPKYIQVFFSSSLSSVLQPKYIQVLVLLEKFNTSSVLSFTVQTLIQH